MDPLKVSVFQFAAQHADSLRHTLQQLMPGMLEVTNRQLTDFLEGEKFGGPPVPTPAGLDHCPLHNLLGENVFGELDFDFNKRRNATLHSRSALHMLRHNKTGKWLRKQGKQSASILAFARKKGKILRDKHREKERIVMLRLRQKLAENKQRQLEKEAKVAANKTELIKRLALVGGPCDCAQDVDALVRNLTNEVHLNNVLKDQIRYQKTILRKGQGLRLGGTTEDLIEGLKAHLGNAEPASASNAAQDSTEVEIEHEPEPFKFQNQGQWVAVYFDNTFYIGQVIHVLSNEKAIVKYLQQVGCNFKWPRVEDTAETDAIYVFDWDIEVYPSSSDMRQWQVSGLQAIADKYETLRQ